MNIYHPPLVQKLKRDLLPRLKNVIPLTQISLGIRDHVPQSIGVRLCLRDRTVRVEHHVKHGHCYRREKSASTAVA